MAKKFPDEAKDVTEPLPGMPNPIEQAQMDKKKAAPLGPLPKPSPAPKKPKGMRSGGYVRAADGCCQRGKTRGKIV